MFSRFQVVNSTDVLSYSFSRGRRRGYTDPITERGMAEGWNWERSLKSILLTGVSGNDNPQKWLWGFNLSQKHAQLLYSIPVNLGRVASPWCGALAKCFL